MSDGVAGRTVFGHPLFCPKHNHERSSLVKSPPSRFWPSIIPSPHYSPFASPTRRVKNELGEHIQYSHTIHSSRSSPHALHNNYTIAILELIFSAAPHPPRLSPRPPITVPHLSIKRHCSPVTHHMGQLDCH